MKFWNRITIIMMAAAISLTGCSGREEENMKRISWKENKCFLNLDVSDGTGFEWSVVWTSDEVAVEDKGYHVYRSDPASAGGKGISAFEITVNADGESIVILKYARPWEGWGDYQICRITSADGVITNVDEQLLYQSSAFESVSAHLPEGWLMLNVPKGWSAEEFDRKNDTSFILRPDDGNGSLRIEYNNDYISEMAEKLTISGKQYLCIKDESGSISVIVTPDNLYFHLENGLSFSEHLTDFIMMLDNAVMDK